MVHSFTLFYYCQTTFILQLQAWRQQLNRSAVKLCSFLFDICLHTHRPPVDNYERLGLHIEVTFFDGFGLTGNYITQIVLWLLAGSEGKLGLDVTEVHHPFRGVVHDVTCSRTG